MSASFYHEALQASAEEIGGSEWVSLRKLAAFLDCPYWWLVTLAYSSSVHRACETTFPRRDDVKLQAAALPVLLYVAAGLGTRVGHSRLSALLSFQAGFTSAMLSRIPEFEPKPLEGGWDDERSPTPTPDEEGEGEPRG